MGHVVDCKVSYLNEFSLRFLETTIMATPILKNIAAIMKKRMIVLVNVGTGCQAFIICCLNCYNKPISSLS